MIAPNTSLERTREGLSAKLKRRRARRSAQPLGFIVGPFKDGWTIEDVENVIARGLPDELLYVPIVISMDPPDCSWSESICLSLVSHQDFNVRGNAVLGLGYLARTCRRLDLARAIPAVAAALNDENPHVRGQAHDAAGDIKHYLGALVPGAET